jgi:hypothetical protein
MAGKVREARESERACLRQAAATNGEEKMQKDGYGGPCASCTPLPAFHSLSLSLSVSLSLPFLGCCLQSDLLSHSRWLGQGLWVCLRH